MAFVGKNRPWFRMLLAAFMAACVALTLGLAGCGGGDSGGDAPDTPAETPEGQGSSFDEACTDENGIPTAYAFVNLTGEELSELLDENGFVYMKTDGHTMGWAKQTDGGLAIIVIGDDSGLYNEEELAEMPRFGKGAPTIFVTLTASYNSTMDLINGLAGLDVEDSASTDDGSYSLGLLDGNVLVEGEDAGDGDFMFTVYNKDAIKSGQFQGGVYGTSVSAIWDTLVSDDEDVQEGEAAAEAAGENLEFAAECVDSHGNPTVYAFCELSGWQYQALLTQAGWTYNTEDLGGAYLSPDSTGVVFFVDYQENPLTEEQIAKLDKCGGGQPVVLIQVVTGYNSIDDVMNGIFGCAVVDSAQAESGYYVAVVHGPSMRNVLVAVQDTGDGTYAISIFTEEALQAGALGTSASIDEVWENETGRPINDGD